MNHPERTQGDVLYLWRLVINGRKPKAESVRCKPYLLPGLTTVRILHS